MTKDIRIFFLHARDSDRITHRDSDMPDFLNKELIFRGLSEKKQMNQRIKHIFQQEKQIKYSQVIKFVHMITYHPDHIILDEKCFGIVKNVVMLEDRMLKYTKVMRFKRKKQQLSKCAPSRVKMDEEEEISLQKEIHIMKEINHPNIVNFYDVYKDKKNIYIVLEFLEGGELYQHLVDKQVYSEAEAKQTIVPIIDAVRYLHMAGIVHRDLKPENIVYTMVDGVQTVKLIDFGVSQIISNETVMSTAIGTPLYMAPQIFEGEKYRGSVDIWSLGVVLYVLLCGYPPFQSESGPALQNQIKTGQIQFYEDDWKDVSPSATDLVKKMLQKRPEHRITMERILDHPWINQDAPEKNLANAKLKLRSAVKKVMHSIKFLKIAKKF